MQKRREISISKAASLLRVSANTVRKWAVAAVHGEPSKIPPEFVRYNEFNGWYYLDADGIRSLRKALRLIKGVRNDDTET